jgi:hypothetical protein
MEIVMWSRFVFLLFSVFAAVTATANQPNAIDANAPLDVTSFVTSDTHVCTARGGISPDVAGGGFPAVHVTADNMEMNKDGQGKPPDATDELSRPSATKPEEKSCVAGLLYRLGNDYVEADFKLPAAHNGVVIGWKHGAAAKYVFPRCYRVWWEGVSASCDHGSWKAHLGKMGRNAECTSYNTNQPHLDIRYK